VPAVAVPPAEAAPEAVTGAARGYVARSLENAQAGTAGPATPSRFFAFTPAGRQVLVEPQVVELDSLVPSHLEDGNLNPAYPHAEGVQPRDRGAAPSQDQVRAIAASLIPERLTPNVEAGFGAPIVADDLVVESGNGRTLALRRAYADPALRETAAAYRAFLAAQGHDVAGMKKPVLISRRVSALSPEERRAFVAEANGRATLDQNVAELARLDAGRLDAALPLWRGGDVDAADNAPFVRAFLAELTAEDRGGLLTARGQLAARGAARLRAALLARAYGDEMGPLLERFLDGRTEGLKAVAGALTDVSARWAALRAAVARGEVDAGMEVTADLVGALRALDDARRLGMTVPDLLLQTDLDRAPLTDTARAFLAAFYREPNYAGPHAGRATIATRLDGFIDEAMKTMPGPDLFGGPPVTPRQILDGAPMREAPPVAAPGEAPVFRFDEPEQSAPDAYAARQAQLLAAADERDAVQLDPPRAEEAVLAEARRAVGQRDFAMPDGEPPETGEVPLRSARALLDEADEAVQQAEQAGLCLLQAAAP
jgi:hypothetical protein